MGTGQLSWQWSLKLYNQWWSLWASFPIADGWWIDHVWMVVGMFSEYCIDIKVGELYSSVLQPCLDVACVRTRENFVLFSVNHSARPLICLTFSSFSIFAKKIVRKLIVFHNDQHIWKIYFHKSLKCNFHDSILSVSISIIHMIFSEALYCVLYNITFYVPNNYHQILRLYRIKVSVLIYNFCQPDVVFSSNIFAEKWPFHFLLKCYWQVKHIMLQKM